MNRLLDRALSYLRGRPEARCTRPAPTRPVPGRLRLGLQDLEGRYVPATVVQTLPVTLTPEAPSQVLAFDLFDPSRGTLTAVETALAGLSPDTTYTLTNPTSEEQYINYTVNTGIEVTRPGVRSPILINSVGLGYGTLPPGHQLVPFQVRNDSTGTFSFPPPGQPSLQTIRPVDPFIGVGAIPLTVSYETKFSVLPPVSPVEVSDINFGAFDGTLTVRYTYTSVDLDIDSDNDDGPGDPGRTDAEEAVEDAEGLPGKRVLATVADLNGDGLPDYKLDRDHDGRPDYLQLGPIRGAGFTRMVLELPESIDPNVAELRFDYDGSSPLLQDLHAVSVSGNTWPAENVRTETPPAPGGLRVWTRDASQNRVVEDLDVGDYVRPGLPHTAAELGFSATTRRVTFYVEGVVPSRTAGDQRILVEVDPDGEGPAGFDLRDAVRVTVTPAERPAVAVPAIPAVNSHPTGWRLRASVSADDGLVVEDVSLGDRYMARMMSLPYVVLDGVRLELKPDGISQGLRVRLVDFRDSRSTPIPADGVKLVIEATYAFDGFPDGSVTALLVTQRYEFWSADESGRGEPTGTYRVARYFPRVSYQFFGQAGSVLRSFSAPQRFHFRIDGVSPNVGAFLSDLPTGLAQNEGGNPLPREAEFKALAGGEESVADNYHQSYDDRIEPPGISHRHPFGVPGEPEGIHIHWIWTRAGTVRSGFERQFNYGKPLIPRGSNQDVNVALARWRDGEQNPRDFRDLIKSESLVHPNRPGGAWDVVFWYDGVGRRATDAFFTHGGFFAPRVPRDVSRLVKVTPHGGPVRVGDGLWVQSVLLENRSLSAIPAPVSLVLFGRGLDVVGGRLVLYTITSPNLFGGPPIISIETLGVHMPVALRGGRLEPGGSVRFGVVFRSAGGEPPRSPERYRVVAPTVPLPNPLELTIDETIDLPGH